MAKKTSRLFVSHASTDLELAIKLKVLFERLTRTCSVRVMWVI